jgi:aspartyl protease family protein
VAYIIDSGASDMTINNSIEKYLKEIGALRSSDYLEPAKYQLADGSIKEYRRVVLHSVKIGDIILDSVVANIAGDSEILLLGKSFLNQFSYWKINNDTKTLELEK